MKRIYTDPEIDNLAEDALNALCLFVQERIGQTDGGNASMFWSGQEDIIRDYVEYELVMKGNSTESNFQKWKNNRYFVPCLASAYPDSNAEPNTPALIYPQALYIEITEDGHYFATLDRTERKTKDLQTIERELYEFALNAGLFD